MADFGIRFFLCNIFICAIIGLFLIAKHLVRRCLTSRMQFHLWFLLLGLLAVPFIPVRPARFSQVFLMLDKWKNAASPGMEAAAETAANVNTSAITEQINDFALSVSDGVPSVIGHILFGIWLIGLLVMLLFVIKSNARLNALKKSALPLQSREVRMIYSGCLSEMKIKREIPIYSTAFLKSPIMTGLFRPRIYLPIHLISDFLMSVETHTAIPEKENYVHVEGHKSIPGAYFTAVDMRFMLLHELQHYKHKDALASCLMNLFGVLYWFNPFVWYALKEMRNDREVACDTSVLKLLCEKDYEAYGNTLINFAEKISLSPFPFAAGISGSMKQMQKRIINISSYEKLSARKKLKGFIVFGIIALMLWGLAPMLSTYAAEQSHYTWNISPEKLELLDLSAAFNGYEGSFVLYDRKTGTWSVYDMEHAAFRTAPNSTYKIYDALFGLEEGVITAQDSFMTWDGVHYPFETWNADQDLHSAMASSVNWYFQEIDKRLGASAIRNYIQKIGYGNENISSDLSSYWMQSRLKISPVEQVELLTRLYNNDLGFTAENINAVKDSILLFSSDNQSFYGKTGTGQVNGNDINGWFIGFIEDADNTYFFAANIQAAENASGSKASEISLSVLSDMGIIKQ